MRAPTSNSSNEAASSAAAPPRSKSTASKSTTASTFSWRAARSSSISRRRVGMGGQICTCKSASTRCPRARRESGAAAHRGAAGAVAFDRLVCELFAPRSARKTAHRARTCGGAARPSPRERNVRGVACTNGQGAQERGAPFGIRFLFPRSTRRSIASERPTRCSCCRPRSCAMPAPRASASQRFRSRILLRPPQNNSTPCTFRPPVIVSSGRQRRLSILTPARRTTTRR